MFREVLGRNIFSCGNLDLFPFIYFTIAIFILIGSALLSFFLWLTDFPKNFFWEERRKEKMSTFVFILFGKGKGVVKFVGRRVGDCCIIF